MRKKAISRMRVFAGPNGSGKSTLFQNMDRLLGIRHFINADEIEKKFKDTGFINFYDYGINVEEAEWLTFIKNSTLPIKAKKAGFEIRLTVKDNILVNLTKERYSYEAALIAEFLRLQFIQLGQSFSFETVMSHISKVQLFDISIQKGFRNYLYFICTESPLINIERVHRRVEKGGHAVPINKIEERYFKSLELLATAVAKTYRAFIFDNSGSGQKLITEVFKGKEVAFHTDYTPLWIKKHLLEKLA